MSQAGSTDDKRFDVYVLNGRGYGGEEVWESITTSGSIPKKDAQALEKRLKSAGKDIMVRDHSDPPDSSPETLIVR